MSRVDVVPSDGKVLPVTIYLLFFRPRKLKSRPRVAFMNHGMRLVNRCDKIESFDNRNRESEGEGLTSTFVKRDGNY